MACGVGKSQGGYIGLFRPSQPIRQDQFSGLMRSQETGIHLGLDGPSRKHVRVDRVLKQRTQCRQGRHFHVPQENGMGGAIGDCHPVRKQGGHQMIGMATDMHGRFSAKALIVKEGDVDSS